MYTINQLAKSLNIPVSTIRYYEKKRLLFPKRGENNYRVFAESDKDQLKLILVMKYSGFSLLEIKEMLSLSDLSDESCKIQTDLLITEKRKELLNKIDNYKRIIDLLDILRPLAIDNVSADTEKLLYKKIDSFFENI